MTERFDFRVTPLAPHHDRERFSCGSDPIDRYLRERSSQDIRRKLSAVFVLEGATADQIAGYYTLSSLSTDPGELPGNVIKKLRLPRARAIPVTLIGQFAIARPYQGQGLGERLLLDALERCWAASKSVASWAVVVDAIDKGAVHFWRVYDFIAFPNSPSRLFLPMATVAQLFETK